MLVLWYVVKFKIAHCSSVLAEKLSADAPKIVSIRARCQLGDSLVDWGVASTSHIIQRERCDQLRLRILHARSPLIIL